MSNLPPAWWTSPYAKCVGYFHDSTVALADAPDTPLAPAHAADVLVANELAKHNACVVPGWTWVSVGVGDPGFADAVLAKANEHFDVVDAENGVVLFHGPNEDRTMTLRWLFACRLARTAVAAETPAAAPKVAGAVTTVCPTLPPQWWEDPRALMVVVTDDDDGIDDETALAERFTASGVSGAIVPTDHPDHAEAVRAAALSFSPSGETGIAGLTLIDAEKALVSLLHRTESGVEHVTYGTVRFLWAA